MVASPSVPKVEPPVTVVAPPPPPPPVAVEKKVETPLRSVITGPSEKLQNEAKLNGNGSLRSVASRNVVVAAEPANNSNRTIVHAPSHRVVVSSQEQNKAKYDSDSDIDLEDSIEPETNGRTCKTVDKRFVQIWKNTIVCLVNTPIDILFPCSAPSITGRMFVTSKQPSPSPSTNNDNKPIRVNRDRLPATKISIGNNASGSSNEKTVTKKRHSRAAHCLFLFSPLDICGYVHGHESDLSCFPSFHDLLISPHVVFSSKQVQSCSTAITNTSVSRSLPYSWCCFSLVLSLFSSVDRVRWHRVL